MSKKIANQVRQGDVLLDPCQIPRDAAPAQVTGDIILAEGEATGHAHRIRKWKNKVQPLTHKGELYLRVLEPVTVDHEEHGIHDPATKTLQPGEYIVRRQVEVWMDEVRRVAD